MLSPARAPSPIPQLRGVEVECAKGHVNTLGWGAPGLGIDCWPDGDGECKVHVTFVCPECKSERADSPFRAPLSRVDL